jgi:hypothetical protein
MDCFGVQSVDTVCRCTTSSSIGRANMFLMPYSLQSGEDFVGWADMQASLHFSLCADQKSGCQSAPSCDLVAVILQCMCTRPSWCVLGKVFVNSNQRIVIVVETTQITTSQIREDLSSHQLINSNKCLNSLLQTPLTYFGWTLCNQGWLKHPRLTQG